MILHYAPCSLPLVVVGLLIWPMVSLHGSFSGDGANQLWFVEHAAESLRLHLRPTLYTNDTDNVLYPNFAFYGGTAFTLAGALALLLGSAPLAYVVTCALALLASYGGWFWLGRMLGLGRWVAQLPALVAITAPWLLTGIYTRGAWPELIATSIMPLLVASLVSVLRADRLRAGPALALAAGVVVFTGTHNLTMLLGGTALAIGAIALGLAIPELRRAVTLRGLGRVLAVAAPAVLVNAWFLLPDLAYQAQTVIVFLAPTWRTTLRDTIGFTSPGSLIRLGGKGTMVPGDPVALRLALPVLAMAWCLLPALLATLRRRTVAAGRALVVLSLLAAALMVLMADAGLLLALPKPYTMMQFSYRLEGELLLAVVGAVLAGLVLLRDVGPRATRWTWVLVPVVAASVLTATLHARDAATTGPSRAFYSQAYPSLETAHNIDYTSARVPIGPPAGIGKAAWFSPEEGDRDNNAIAQVVAAPGERVRSNIAAMPPLVELEGARIVGNGAWTGSILQIDRDAEPGVQTIRASQARPWPVRLGEALSLLGLAGLAVNAALIARGGRRRRRTTAG